MNKFSNWLKNEESGQGMVEYGLIVALIAIVIVAALVVLGPEIASIYIKR
ncbi:MAG: Flp family type IVb pilin [Clostridiales bacterium]|nr:Flp family type IVb pilin [Clostridiales bacterium]